MAMAIDSAKEEEKKDRFRQEKVELNNQQKWIPVVKAAMATAAAKDEERKDLFREEKVEQQKWIPVVKAATPVAEEEEKKEDQFRGDKVELNKHQPQHQQWIPMVKAVATPAAKKEENKHQFRQEKVELNDQQKWIHVVKDMAPAATKGEEQKKKKKKDQFRLEKVVMNKEQKCIPMDMATPAAENEEEKKNHLRQEEVGLNKQQKWIPIVKATAATKEEEKKKKKNQFKQEKPELYNQQKWISMATAATKEGKKEKELDLLDWVFSWSIPDVMNKTLFKNRVEQIPLTFSSTDQYLQSFVYPLIEETHADLFSSLTTVSQAPVLKVYDIVEQDEQHETSSDSNSSTYYYSILLKKVEENKNEEEDDDDDGPVFGDLFAITDVKPNCIDDLNRPGRPYTLAIIQGFSTEPSYFTILSSKPILGFKKVESDDDKDKDSSILYAVYLTNMVTNTRIWNAIHSAQDVVNMKIINNVLQIDAGAGEDCKLCSTGGLEDGDSVYSRKVMGRFTSELDYSQKYAILKCIETKECHHQNTVRLIWGPPGTGKTKTVASLLAILLEIKCRTLTCTPTNIAVLGVINRLVNLVKPTLKFDTYGLGDIVLFGNAKRMKIDDYEDLFHVFLDNRVSALVACLSPMTGWRGSVESMKKLLQEPEKEYQNYLKKEKEEDEQEESSSVKTEKASNEPTKNSERINLFKKVVTNAVMDNKKKKFRQKKGEKCKKNKGKLADKEVIILTFEEFFIQEFKKFKERLIFYLTSLYTHLPKRFIKVIVVKEMIRLIDILQILGNFYDKIVAADGMTVREAFNDSESDGKYRKKHYKEVTTTRKECLKVLDHLHGQIQMTKLIPGDNIRSFCLENATLIFCTASSSVKLNTNGMTPLDLLIVDEAAQLKECESTIPLQLPGLRHAILIGDEKQLPAMVQSKISEEADFGRSLFQRLVMLKHKKQLLSIQYRMHPSISLFPNKEFYGGQIKDGPNVRAQSYQKCFLDGQIYGPYSFIDISYGKEQLNEKYSSKNLVEVYVIAEIIANLHQKSRASKQKLRVGCISPYKAQVFAIKDKLGKTYSTDANSEFSVNVRSVDGFQGGEEDVIIISTVRCNGNGSVGFLSNLQRTNVAITRARHCLWILGNSATLINSGSVWKKLVLDSKTRGCFHNATDDKNLVRAISSALLELRLHDKLLSIDLLLLRTTARWKVNFSKEFMESLGRNMNLDVYKEAITVIGKLANGWRQTKKDKILTGTSSLLLEIYEVKDDWRLVWTVDVERENTYDIQVMKVWGILQRLKIQDLVKELDKFFGNYTINKISQCKYQQVDGGLVVPMKWPVDSNWIERTSDDATRGLVSRLATMKLENDDEQRPTTTSSKKCRNYEGRRGSKW